MNVAYYICLRFDYFSKFLNFSKFLQNVFNC